jgi:CBS domain-containing protein
LKVRDVMQSGCPAVGANYNAADVLDILTENRGRTVPVVNDAGHVVGMIGVGDIARATSAANARRVWTRSPTGATASCGIQAHEIMSSPVVSIFPDAPLEEAVELFLQHEFRLIPVLEDSRLVGVLLRSQLM